MTDNENPNGVKWQHRTPLGRWIRCYDRSAVPERQCPDGEGPYPWPHRFFCEAVSPGHWSEEPNHRHEERRLGCNGRIDALEKRVKQIEDYHDVNPSPSPETSEGRGCALCGHRLDAHGGYDSICKAHCLCGGLFKPQDPAPAASGERCQYKYQSNFGYTKDDHLEPGGRSVVVDHPFVPSSAGTGEKCQYQIPDCPCTKPHEDTEWCHGCRHWCGGRSCAANCPHSPAPSSAAKAPTSEGRRWRCNDCGRTFVDQRNFPPEAHDLQHFHQKPRDFDPPIPCPASGFTEVIEATVAEARIRNLERQNDNQMTQIFTLQQQAAKDRATVERVEKRLRFWRREFNNKEGKMWADDLEAALAPSPEGEGG